MAKIEDEEAAARLARAIASDIALYNEQKIVEGIQNDSLFDVLADEIEEGLNLYKGRVSDQLLSSTNFYYRAIVDRLLKNKAHVESFIW
jgi:hypothetical protein